MSSARPASTPACPTQNLAGEKVVAGQPSAPPRLHLGDEVVVNLRLEPLQAQNVLRPFGTEGIEHALVLAGGVDPAFDAVAGDQVLKAEGRGDHPDRAGDAVGIKVDHVGGGGEPVAAGGRDVLDEGVDRDLELVGEATNAGGDQARLRRASPWRVDRQRHGLGLAAAKGGLDQGCETGVGQRRRAEAGATADHALEPQHRNPRPVAGHRAADKGEGIFHRPDVGRRPAPRKAGT